MNLSEPFIRRPIMTILVMGAIMAFGIIAFRALPVSDLPSVDMPTIEVSVSYPGANPETMANSVATPLEQQFMTIQGIQSVISSSNTGSSTIVLTFDLSRNIDSAATDVQAMISVASPQLPSNLPNQPTYRKVNPAATPILYFALINPNMTLSELYDYGSTFIGNRLSMIEGVSQVITYGTPYAARIQVDPEKLAAKNIGIDEVAMQLATGNVDLPLGTLWGEKNDFTIDVDGQIFKAKGYDELVIKNENGNLVKIKDIGRTLDSVQDDKYFMQYIDEKSSQNCLVLAVQRLAGANTVKIVNQVNQTLASLKPQLPSTLNIVRIYDQSESIIEGVNDVKMTLVIAFFLVVIIIYLLLGKFLNTVIPTLALPIAICGTFAVMLLLGFSLDILSLLALTLCIGFLVDDAIVVLENNVRHVELGKKPFEAALIASKEISVTILSMTLCLTAAFIPMLFMGGVVGRLFREFAVTIVVAVLISGFVSLTLTPMLASRFVRPYKKKQKARMEEMADKVNEKMLRLYQPCLGFAMRNRPLMLMIGLFSIIFSIVLFAIIPKDFLPPDDVGFIDGYTVARDGTSPFQMNKYHGELSKLSIENPNVESLLSISSYSNPNQGILFLRLKPFKDRKPMNQVITELTNQMHNVVGMNTYFSPLPLINLAVGTTSQALYQYALTSIDRHSLYEYAPKLTQAMIANPQFSQVSSDLRIGQPQWSFHINRDKASNYNVTASQVENFFQYAYSDNKISQINADINVYDVILETLPKFYRNPTVLSNLYVRSSTSNLVPLSEILEPTETAGPLTINHLNGLTAVNISFNPGINVPLGNSLKTLNDMARADKPANVFGQVIGTADVFKQSFASLNFLLIISFFVIYLVLGILYESFIHPITVMSALPPALLGGLFTLYLFNQTLSIYSFVGLILLIGIVLKNGIIMVDFANNAVEKEGKTAEAAITEAALVRFRPIMMTTIAAMMGAVPIALGIGGALAQNRISLGLCIVGGLIISQMLTLLLTPVLYYYFELLQEKLFKMRHTKRT
ncbi:MAG TPA: efflux RND transporter permease subunit [Chlamydiales bacterium]|nr:efflux RND transporter permease subunit [Chlamydiales bacterium]